jgi:secreted PhoX family phosphatase
MTIRGMPNDEHLHPGTGKTFESILGEHLSRRRFLGAGAAIGAGALAGPLLGPPRAGAAAAPAIGKAKGKAKLTFVDVPSAPSTEDQWRIPAGYVGGVLLAWGDPIFAGEPVKSPFQLSAADQTRRFGYNCDFTAYLPLRGEDRGLLWVNHEYSEGARMFPGYVAANATAAQVGVELAAHGGTVVEIARTNGEWRPVLTSRYNRRIDANQPMALTGPAAGHRLLQTKDDPSGRTVLGMLNNCGGGVTPWGTILTCEENFNQYFANAGQVGDATVKASHARYGVTAAASDRRWENHLERFDTAKVPNEPFRFGWVVEIDPMDPASTPKKRTALGRTKHEAAATALAKDKRAVVYLGDDERFDYAYKFVTKGRVNTSRPAANRDLLDEGTLYVARFDSDGTGTWIAVDISNPALAGSSTPRPRCSSDAARLPTSSVRRRWTGLRTST